MSKSTHNDTNPSTSIATATQSSSPIHHSSVSATVQVTPLAGQSISLSPAPARQRGGGGSALHAAANPQSESLTVFASAVPAYSPRSTQSVGSSQDEGRGHVRGTQSGHRIAHTNNNNYLPNPPPPHVSASNNPASFTNNPPPVHHVGNRPSTINNPTTIPKTQQQQHQQQQLCVYSSVSAAASEIDETVSYAEKMERKGGRGNQAGDFVPARGGWKSKGNAGDKGTTFSLSLFSVSVATVLILLTAAVVLTVTVVYSLKAADEFAQSYSQANIIAAVSKVNDFVTIPLNTYSEMKLGAHFGYLPNLVTGTDFIDTNNKTNATAIALLDEVRQGMYVDGWLSRMQAMLFAANFNLLYVAIGLADKSWISCVVTNLLARGHECAFVNPKNVTQELENIAISRPLSSNFRQTERFINGSTKDDPHIVYSTSTYNPQTRPWYINAPKTPEADPIFSSVYVDFNLGVPIVDVNGPLYSADGTFLGVTSLSLDLRQISSFLTQLPRTSHSITVLVDSEGYMLGGSDGGALSSASDPFPPASPPSPTLSSGCEQYNNSTSGLASIVCRLTPATYGNAKLQALRNEHPSMFAQDGASFTRSVRVGGEACVVSKSPITARTALVQAPIHWQMYTIMPVSDVTGQIVTGRNVAIIIACVMVAVSCAVCGIALFVLLKPLSVLADLMEGASELKDDMLGASVDKSVFREIRTIQDAFGRLGQQLQRAKSFLPASLLAQLESGLDDDDEDEGDGDGDGGFGHGDGETAVSSQARRARQQGGTASASNTEHDTYASSANAQKRRRGGPSGARRTDTMSRMTGDGGLAPSPSGHKVISSSVSLGSKSVTVAAVNLRHFHRTVGAASASLEGSYGRLVDAYQSIAKDCRGIMDSFHGDRFFFTFNAVRPCSAHAAMGATAMLRIASLRSHHASLGISLDNEVTCGVATGRCMVGNLGSDRAKRFTVVGPAFSYATVLERLCKRYPNTSVLLANETAQDCETAVGMLLMDVIAVPSSVGLRDANKQQTNKSALPIGGTDGPLSDADVALTQTNKESSQIIDEIDHHDKAVTCEPIAAAIYSKGHATDEWMYEIYKANSACVYTHANIAFRAALTGDVSTAREHLDNFTDTSPQSAWARERIASFLREGVTPTPTPGKIDGTQGQCIGVVPADLGYFYDVCVSNSLPKTSSQTELQKTNGKLVW